LRIRLTHREWTPPKTRSALTEFRNLDSDLHSISRENAMMIFSLTSEKLEKIPKVQRRDDEDSSNYWLFHAWDFQRFRTSASTADAALAMWIRADQEKTRDAIGLGACATLVSQW
jgi:hypothetical protein